MLLKTPDEIAKMRIAGRKAINMECRVFKILSREDAFTRGENHK